MLKQAVDEVTYTL